MAINNEINKAEHKSITKKYVKYETYKRALKFFTAATSLVTALVMSISMATYKQAKKNTTASRIDKEVVNLTSDGNYADIIAQYTYRVNNNKDIAYDMYGLSKAIINVDSTYFDLVIYNAYQNMSYRGNNLDELFIEINKNLDSIKENNPEVYYKMLNVKSFKDYMKKMKFIDENDEISTKAYETYGEGLYNSYEKVMNNRVKK